MCKSQAEGGRRCPSSAHYVSTPEKRERNALLKRAKRVERRRAEAVARSGAPTFMASGVVEQFLSGHPSGEWRTHAGFKDAVKDTLALVAPPVQVVGLPVNLNDQATREAALTVWNKESAEDAYALAEARLSEYRVPTDTDTDAGLDTMTHWYVNALRHDNTDSLEFKPLPKGVTREMRQGIVDKAQSDIRNARDAETMLDALRAVRGQHDPADEDATEAVKTLQRALADPASVSEDAVTSAASRASSAYAATVKRQALDRRIELATALVEAKTRDVDMLTSRGVREPVAKALVDNAFANGEKLTPTLARNLAAVDEFPAELKAAMFGVPISVFAE